MYKKQKLLGAALNDKALLAQVATLTADLNALKQKRKATASANPEAEASTAGSTHEGANNEGQLEPKKEKQKYARPWFLSNMVSDVLLLGVFVGQPMIMRTCVWGPPHPLHSTCEFRTDCDHTTNSSCAGTCRGIRRVVFSVQTPCIMCSDEHQHILLFVGHCAGS